MGDDNEIRLLVRRESRSFLAKAFTEADGSARSYDFEREWAKTSKNRSLLVTLTTVATIAVLGGISFGVTRVIERRTASAPVDVTAFEDLNLKDLLDTAKRNESDLARARLEMERLDYDLKAGLEAADRDYLAAAESIGALGLGQAEEARRLRIARDAAERTRRGLRYAYAPQAQRKKAEMADIQSRIDQYDQRLTDQARRQQELLENERRVFELEKARQTDLYEGRIAELKASRARDVATLKRQRDELAASLTSRFNPRFADERSVALLDGYAAPASIPAPVGLPPYLEAEDFAAPGTAARLERSLDDFLFLSSRLRSVPYLNSVPAALSRMEAEVRESASLYSDALAKAGAGLEERDARIGELEARAAAAERALASYAWAVDQYVRESQEGGYLLDTRDPERVSVALNPGVPAAAGAIGYVVRGAAAVATLSFYLAEGRLCAKVVALAEGESIRPFDAVLIQASSAPAKKMEAER